MPIDPGDIPGMPPGWRPPNKRTPGLPPRPTPPTPPPEIEGTAEPVPETPASARPSYSSPDPGASRKRTSATQFQKGNVPPHRRRPNDPAESYTAPEEPSARDEDGRPIEVDRIPSVWFYDRKRYDRTIGDRIIDRIVAGESLRTICRDGDMPDRSTINKWVTDDVDGFGRRWLLAKELQADELMDQAKEIALNVERDYELRINKEGREEIIVVKETTASRKLAVEFLERRCANLAPRRYGQNLEVQHTGAVAVVNFNGISEEEALRVYKASLLRRSS